MSEALIVTFGIIGLIASITITAIVRYNAEDVLKIWSSLSVIVALLVGGIGTYFFTRDPIARETLRVAKERVEVAEAKDQTSLALKKINTIKETLETISLRQKDIDKIAKYQIEHSSTPNDIKITDLLEGNETDAALVDGNLKALKNYMAPLTLPSKDTTDNSKTH